MCEQNASYLSKHSELGSKNLHKIFLKIIQKALLKQPLQHVNFQNFPKEHVPGPPRAFLVSQSASNLFHPNNLLEKNVEIMALPFKISHYITGHKRKI